MTDVQAPPTTDPFDAYYRRDVPQPDDELTRGGTGHAGWRVLPAVLEPVSSRLI